ncbi:MAG: phage major capsid protein, partial [Pseudomonadota bacterium]
LSHTFRVFLYGNGQYEPEGILVNEKIPSVNSDAITIEVLHKMLSIINTSVNSHLCWIMHEHTFILIRKLQFENNYFHSIIEGKTLLGYNVYFISEMSTPYAFIGDNPCVVGLLDTKNAYTFVIGPESSKRIESPYHATICTFKRIGGKIMNQLSIVKLNLNQKLTLEE